MSEATHSAKDVLADLKSPNPSPEAFDAAVVLLINPQDDKGFIVTNKDDVVKQLLNHAWGENPDTNARALKCLREVYAYFRCNTPDYNAHHIFDELKKMAFLHRCYPMRKKAIDVLQAMYDTHLFDESVLKEVLHSIIQHHEAEQQNAKGQGIVEFAKDILSQVDANGPATMAAPARPGRLRKLFGKFWPGRAAG